jgi:phosphonate transport system permease protein
MTPESHAPRRTSVHTLRNRVIGFALDAAIVYYVLHASMYLYLVFYGSQSIAGFNYYRNNPYTAFFNPLKLSSLYWWIILGGTLLAVILLRTLGRSLGQRVFGLSLQSDAHQRVKVQQRLVRILLFPISVLIAPAQLAVAAFSRRLQGVVLLHDRVSQSTIRTYVHPTGVPQRRIWQTQWGWISLALLALTLFLGWILIEANLGALFSRTEEARRVFLNIVRPDFTHFTMPEPTFYQRAYPQMFSIVNLMVVTILMALAATILGAVFALPLSFLGARNLMAQSKPGWFIFVITRGFFNIFRSIEALIWVVVFAVWIGYGNPFTGVMALVVHTIAALGKLYSEQVESIDPGPIEAILASGGSRLQVIRYAIIPQVMPSFLAFTLYRWDINVRMATIIALVGGGGIGDMLFYYRHMGDWSQVGAVVVAMVVVVWTLDYISGRVRERIA